jgi:hypothetical protein
LSKSCQKGQKVVKKVAKKDVKKLSKSSQKVSTNSQTGRRRRRRRRRRRFVAPRPGTTLSHLVKTISKFAKKWYMINA